MENSPKYFSDNLNVLKHGYYQVNDFRSLSKFEAWQYAKKLKVSTESIQYHYNSDAFSKIDWSVEPTETIEELYIKRAKSLRERYDYLVVVYSGGIDGHVALETFLKNNIKIDEIVTFWNSIDPKGIFNQEVFNSAVPYVNSLDLKKLGIKFSLIDIGPGLQSQFKDVNHRHDYFYAMNGLICPWNHYVRSGKAKLEIFPHHVELSRKNKTVGYVWGIDKPNLFIEDGHYVFKFVDSTPDFGVRVFISEKVYRDSVSNLHDEPFYISRDAPEILIKQCHLLASLLNTMSRDDPRLVSYSNLKIGETHIVFENNEKDPSKTRLLSKRALHETIYPGAPYDRFGDDKVPGSVMYIKRDAWFFREKSIARNDAVEFFKKTVRDNNDYFRYTLDGVPDGPIRMIDNTVYKIKKKNG